MTEKKPSNNSKNTSNSNQIKRLIPSQITSLGVSLCLLLTTGLSSPSFADPILPIQTGKAAQNDMAIDYSEMNKILNGIVLVKPVHSRLIPEKVVPPSGTRVVRTNKKNTRLDANRLMLHLMEDGNKIHFRDTRKTLEKLPDTYPLDQLSSDVQLAYWLNLRNLTVIEALMDNYPMTKTEKFMRTAANEKRITVAGQHYSIKEVEALIMARWPRQHVVYGFYNGAIGGPNIMKTAFTGANVWSMLTSNGEEFMTSLRGFQYRRKTANVSSLYTEYPALFPDPKVSVKKHYLENLSGKLKKTMQKTTKVKLELSDWHIADLMGGILGLGTSGSIATAKNKTDPKRNLAMQKYPAHVREYFMGIQRQMLYAQKKKKGKKRS